MNVTHEEFIMLKSIIQELCGIVIEESKKYLIETRLSSVCEEFECCSFSELVSKLKNDNGTVNKEIINAITTNETLFFRDSSPFEGLKYKILPELIDVIAASATPKKLRIWSAACSSGQEPYSVAMMLAEMIPDIDNWDIHILGTDISDAAIHKASYGGYTKHEIERGLPPEYIDKYFTLRKNIYHVNDEIRYLVNFSRQNLLEPFSYKGPFDVVLCRNVAIYFDKETREKLFNRIAGLITRNGFLVVGSAENLIDLGDKFRPQNHCRSAFYQPNMIHPTPAI